MRSTLRRWGNSASVRIPAAIMASAKLHVDQAVEIREEKGRVIIEPLTIEIDLDAMIDAITDENRHAETDWGPPVGKEIW